MTKIVHHCSSCSLSINVNTTFFQVPRRKIQRHVARVPCTRALKWAPGPFVHIVIVNFGAIHCFVLAAKLKFQNCVYDREKLGETYDQHCSILLAEFNMPTLLFMLIRSL